MKRDPQDGKYPKYFYLCGLHFEDDNFERDVKYEITGSKRTFKLKANAVPSIFGFLEAKKRRTLSESRKEKNEIKNVASSLLSPEGPSLMYSDKIE